MLRGDKVGNGVWGFPAFIGWYWGGGGEGEGWMDEGTGREKTFGVFFSGNIVFPSVMVMLCFPV